MFAHRSDRCVGIAAASVGPGEPCRSPTYRVKLMASSPIAPTKIAALIGAWWYRLRIRPRRMAQWSRVGNLSGAKGSPPYRSCR